MVSDVDAAKRLFAQEDLNSKERHALHLGYGEKHPWAKGNRKTAEYTDLTGDAANLKEELSQMMGPKELARLIYQSDYIDYKTLVSSPDFREGISTDELFDKYVAPNISPEHPFLVDVNKWDIPDETMAVLMSFPSERLADFCEKHPDLAPMYYNRDQSRWSVDDRIIENNPMETWEQKEIKIHSTDLHDMALQSESREQFIYLLMNTSPNYDFAERMETYLEDAKAFIHFQDAEVSPKMKNQWKVLDKLDGMERGWQEAEQTAKWMEQSGFSVKRPKSEYPASHVLIAMNSPKIERYGVTVHQESTITDDIRDDFHKISASELFTYITDETKCGHSFFSNEKQQEVYRKCITSGKPLDYKAPHRYDYLLNALDKEIINFGPRASAMIKANHYIEEDFVHLERNDMPVPEVEGVTIPKLCIKDTPTKDILLASDPDLVRAYVIMHQIVPDPYDFAAWNISGNVYKKEQDITKENGIFYSVTPEILVTDWSLRDSLNDKQKFWKYRNCVETYAVSYQDFQTMTTEQLLDRFYYMDEERQKKPTDLDLTDEDIAGLFGPDDSRPWYGDYGSDGHSLSPDERDWPTFPEFPGKDDKPDNGPDNGPSPSPGGENGPEGGPSPSPGEEDGPESGPKPSSLPGPRPLPGEEDGPDNWLLDPFPEPGPNILYDVADSDIEDLSEEETLKQ